MKITKEATHKIFDLAKQVFNGNMKKEEVKSLAEIEQLMSRASAVFYVDIYAHLRKGIAYKKTMNHYSTEYFLRSIHTELGNKALSMALISVNAHLNYYNEQGKGQQVSITKLVDSLTDEFKILDIVSSNYPDEVNSTTEYVEGAVKKVTINAYERNMKARRRCIEIHGLICKVCDFNFEKSYGEIGLGFVHVHHVIDLANISKEYEVNPETDLVPVCPNCHAMLHKTKPAMSVDALKEILKSNQ